MKKLVLTLIVSVVMMGAIKAQQYIIQFTDCEGIIDTLGTWGIELTQISDCSGVAGYNDIYINRIMERTEDGTTNKHKIL